MINKNNIAIARVCAKSNIKPQLQCVAFYGDRTVATDGFGLIEVSATGDKREVPILYTAKYLEQVKIKKGEFVDESSLPIQKDTIAGSNYPNVDSIMHYADDDQDNYASIMINAEYLGAICAVLKNIHPNSHVTLKVPTGNNLSRPIVLLTQSQLGDSDEPKQTARALLMPINQ